MTRVVVQRGAGGSSSNVNRPPASPVPQTSASTSKADEQEKEVPDDQIISVDLIEQSERSEEKNLKEEDTTGTSQVINIDSGSSEYFDKDKALHGDIMEPELVSEEIASLRFNQEDLVLSDSSSSQVVTGGSFPPPPPVPPPKPSATNTNLRRTSSGSSSALKIGSLRKQVPRVMSNSRPSSPQSYGEGEGYNSADEHSPCYVSSYYDAERERQFENDIRRVKGLEVKRMLEDGNCLFRAVADQVYGDSEAQDLARQLCIDYMERDRDHFSQFITEGFASYCKRKRRDKIYGNNAEIQAFAEMYNRPIHIYSYSTEPINIFQGSYVTDTPPIRLSYHHGNHYNSLVDPRRLAVGAGLGFSSLRGRNIDKDQVKAAIKAQQDQQIDKALLAEGRFYSDLELTEKEIERMVIEASRAEYLAKEKFKQYPASKESSTSTAEPSSSGATTTGSSRSAGDGGYQKALLPDMGLPSSMQMLLAMGFSYMHVIEAHSIFGDDVDSMICYLVEMSGASASPGGINQRKGKAAQ